MLSDIAHWWSEGRSRKDVLPCKVSHEGTDDIPMIDKR